MNRSRGFLAALGERERDALRSLGRTVEVADGQQLMRQGGSSEDVVIIEDGLASVTVTTRDGHQVLLALLAPGDIAGELGVLEDRPRSATVVARGAGRVRRIRAADLVDFLASSPSAAMALLRLLSHRLRQADRAQVDLAVSQTPIRVARRLLELAADHGELVGDTIVIGLGLTQSELAAWVGASREGVSEALRRLREDGIVDTGRRSITILDLDLLRDRALR